MKYKIIKIFISIVILSCNSDSLLITPGIGVGDFKIGEKLPKVDYNKNDFILFLNKKDNTVTQIEIISKKYYTIKEIKVGDSYNNVIDKYGSPLKEPSLDKSKSNIKKEVEINKTLRYEGILFQINTEKKIVQSIKIF